MTHDLSKLISEEAERLDSYYQVARVFADSLGRVLRGTGWTTTVDFDNERLGFRVELSKTGWSTATVAVARFISDEELNLNTESKERFSKYVRTLVQEMREEGGEPKERQQRQEEGGWYEATGKNASGFLTQQVRDAHSHILIGGAPTTTTQPQFLIGADGTVRDAHHGRAMATGSSLKIEAMPVQQEEELDAVASVAESIKRLHDRDQ